MHRRKLFGDSNAMVKVRWSVPSFSTHWTRPLLLAALLAGPPVVDPSHAQTIDAGAFLNQRPSSLK